MNSSEAYKYLKSRCIRQTNGERSAVNALELSVVFLQMWVFEMLLHKFVCKLLYRNLVKRDVKVRDVTLR